MAEQESHRTSRADAAQARLRRQEDAKGATVEVAVSGRRPRSGVSLRRSPLFLCPRRPGLLSTKSAEHTESQGLRKDDQSTSPNVLGILEGRACQVASLRPSSLNPPKSKQLGLRLLSSRTADPAARGSAQTLRAHAAILQQKKGFWGYDWDRRGACSYTPLCQDPRMGESREEREVGLKQLPHPNSFPSFSPGGPRSLD